jgi:hypothetical protein
MYCLRSAAATTLCLVRRSAVPVAVVAILVGMFSTRDQAPAPSGGMPARGRERPIMREGDETLRVTMSVPEGDITSRCILQDEAGKEFMMIYKYTDKSWGFGSGNDASVRTSGQHRKDGSIALGVGNPKLRLEIELTPEGSPLVKVFDNGQRLLGQYQVAPEGELVRVDPDPKQ